MMHPYWYILLTGLAAILPMLATVGTAYIKVSIVFAALRNAFGVQGFPGTMLTGSVAMIVSFAVMGPTIDRILLNLPEFTQAELQQPPGVDKLAKLRGAFEPWYEFMQRHTSDHEREVAAKLFNTETLSKEIPTAKEAKSAAQPWHPVLVAYLLSELREGFMMAFAVLIPFVVIDMIVANLLVGLGMMMMSPTSISLPIKIFVFIAADGWVLMAQSLLQSYQ